MICPSRTEPAPDHLRSTMPTELLGIDLIPSRNAANEKKMKSPIIHQTHPGTDGVVICARTEFRPNKDVTIITPPKVRLGTVTILSEGNSACGIHRLQSGGI